MSPNATTTSHGTLTKLKWKVQLRNRWQSRKAQLTTGNTSKTWPPLCSERHSRCIVEAWLAEEKHGGNLRGMGLNKDWKEGSSLNGVGAEKGMSNWLNWLWYPLLWGASEDSKKASILGWRCFYNMETMNISQWTQGMPRNSTEVEVDVHILTKTDLWR